MSFYVYIIECKNGSLYTGFTRDIKRRYQAHVAGKAARYTRSFPPKKLAAYWCFDSKSDAMSVEYQIKQMSKSEKLALIAGRT